MNQNRQSESPLIRWKKLITAGNLGYEVCDYSGAISCYANAKRVALKLFDDSRNPKKVIPMLVISHHNLADVYKKKNDIFQAHKELNFIHCFLIDYLNGSQKHTPTMREALFSGINKAQVELFNFLKENPIMHEDNAIPSHAKLH